MIFHFQIRTLVFLKREDSKNLVKLVSLSNKNKKATQVPKVCLDISKYLGSFSVKN
jgi:hypothetical protein